MSRVMETFGLSIAVQGDAALIVAGT